MQSCDRSFISYCRFLLIYLAILLLHSLRRRSGLPILLFATIAAFRNLFVKKDPLTRNIQRYITHTFHLSLSLSSQFAMRSNLQDDYGPKVVHSRFLDRIYYAINVRRDRFPFPITFFMVEIARFHLFS